MKDDLLYLQHIRDALARILEYTREGHAHFLEKTVIQDAVIRNIEIVGEATKHVSQKTRAENPHIPWSNMAGMRDVMIHDYMNVETEAVWFVVTNRVPEVFSSIMALIEKMTASHH